MTPPHDRLDFDCADLQVFLSGYLDDELPPGTRLAADRHLVACDACRARVDEMERLDRLVAAEAGDFRAAMDAADAAGRPDAAAGLVLAEEDPPGRLPAGFAEEVLRRTAGERPASSPRLTLLAWSGWLAAAAAIVVAVTAMTAGGPGRPVDAGLAADPESRVWDRARATLASSSVFRSSTLELPEPAAPAPRGDAAGPGAGDETGGPPDLADAQTLAQAAFVLDSLRLDDPAEVERARRIATYDDLADRLASLAADRTFADPDLAAAIERAAGLVRRLEAGAGRGEAVRELAAAVRSGDLVARLARASAAIDTALAI